MTILQTILAALNWNVRVTENFEAVSPAALYARNPATSANLTWGFYGGRFGMSTVADGTVALTASATNYVVANRSSGAVSASTSITNWNNATDYMRLYLVVTGVATVTGQADHRQAIGATGGGGGGSGVASVVAGSGISVDDTDPANPIISATGGTGPTPVVAQAGTSLLAIDANAGSYIRFTNAAAKTYSFDSAETYTLGSEFQGRNAGVGNLTLTAVGGFALNAPAGGTLVVPQGGTFAVKIVGAAEADVLGVTVAAP